MLANNRTHSHHAVCAIDALEPSVSGARQHLQPGSSFVRLRLPAVSIRCRGTRMSMRYRHACAAPPSPGGASAGSCAWALSSWLSPAPARTSAAGLDDAIGQALQPLQTPGAPGRIPRAAASCKCAASTRHPRLCTVARAAAAANSSPHEQAVLEQHLRQVPRVHDLEPAPRRDGTRLRLRVRALGRRGLCTARQHHQRRRRQTLTPRGLWTLGKPNGRVRAPF